MRPGEDDEEPAEEEAASIARKARRKERAARQRDRGVWYGLGMFGLVGWAVAVPLVAGVAIGVWIDTRHPSETSWTLILLFVGAALGCLNAWYWIRKEGPDD